MASGKSPETDGLPAEFYIQGLLERYLFDFDFRWFSKSLQRSLYMLERFGEISGLRVNREKTEVLWIGSLKGSNPILCPDKNLTWGKR